MQILSLSENTLLVLYEQEIGANHPGKIAHHVALIYQAFSDCLIDVVPSYASIHISFQCLKISGADLRNQLHKRLNQAGDALSQQTPRNIEIAVYYGEEVALDLDYIAERSGLSTAEVIRLHSDASYDVYAIGFAPGFAYLGNVDKRIATPRKETPRQKVLRGSLGIADQQTAIYPSDSPGGWQIIGKTPLAMIDYQSKNLTQFSIGDTVRFIPIDRDAFLSMGGTFE